VNRIILREYLQEQIGWFKDIEGILCTSFTFDSSFFENNVLPLVFVVEDKNESIRRIKINDKLTKTDVAVFYDANNSAKIGGKYRYQVKPMRVPGRFFHPKIIVIAGKDTNDDPVVFVSVSSANLSMSGWGRQEEVTGGIYIYTDRQEAHGQLLEFLRYLDRTTDKNGEIRAISRIMSVMRTLKGYRKKEFDHGGLYFSGIRGAIPFSSFLKEERDVHRWDILYAFSPYWQDVERQVENFNTREIVLIPTVNEQNRKYNLTPDQVEKLKNITADDCLHIYDFKKSRYKQIPFRHAKAYIIGKNDKVRIGIGSCNFTHSGLAGASGNVECMLVFNGNKKIINELDYELKEITINENNAETTEVSDFPVQIPFEISVIFNWAKKEFEYSYNPTDKTRLTDVVLKLAGYTITLDNPVEKVSLLLSQNNIAVDDFTVEYVYNGDRKTYYGIVLEINLSLSEKIYTRKLKIDEIIESWRNHEDSWISKINTIEDEDFNREIGTGVLPRDVTTVSDIEDDVFNYYDYYRAFYDLSDKLEKARKAGNHALLTAYLESRPDSVRNTVNEIDEIADIKKRFLLLLEIQSILQTYRKYLTDTKLRHRVNDELKKMKKSIVDALFDEIENTQGLPGDFAPQLIEWFENKIREIK